MASEYRTITASGRRPQACERCRKRKQKCDRLLPTCTACAEVNTQCRSREPIGSFTDESNSLSHAAVPDYVDALKRKAEELGVQLKRRRPQLEPSVSVSPHASANNMPSTGMQGSDQISNASFAEPSVQAAIDEIGFLSRDAMAEPRHENLAFPQELSTMNMVRRASLAVSGHDPTQAAAPCSHHRILARLAGGHTDTLNREFSAPYLERFLSQVGPMFLHICPAQRRRQFVSFFNIVEGDGIRRGYGRGGDSSFIAFNTLMMVAIGMLLSPDSEIGLLAINLHVAAMEVFNKIHRSHDTVSVLDSLFLLVIYSTVTSFGGSTWHLVGLAMKKAISFKLHKETPPSPNMSSWELNQRRNIFWSFYIIDRTISCILDRPFCIQDDDISLQFPDHDTTSKNVEEFEFACHVINHARLISSMRTSRSLAPEFHYGNLCYWKDFPQSIKRLIYTDSFLASRIRQLTCRALIQVVELRVSRNSRTTMTEEPGAFEQEVSIICKEYINEEYLRSEQHSFAGSFIDGLDLFGAGLMLICGPSTTFPTSRRWSETSVMNKCTTLLTIIGERFSSIKVLRRVLFALSSFALHEQVDEPILYELPDVIPDSMQAFIHRFIRQQGRGS